MLFRIQSISDMLSSRKSDSRAYSCESNDVPPMQSVVVIKQIGNTGESDQEEGQVGEEVVKRSRGCDAQTWTTE